MRKTTLVVLLFFLIKAALPQQTFFTHIQDGNIHTPFDMLIMPDGNILTCSFYRSDDKSWSSIWELDQAGEIIDEWTFKNTSIEFFRTACMLEVDNQIFLFGGGQKSNQGNVEKFVSMRKFDLQLNELDNFCFHLNGMIHDGLFPRRVAYRDSSFHIFTTVVYGVEHYFTAAYFKVSSGGGLLHSAFLPPSSGEIPWPYDFCLFPGSDNLFTLNLDGTGNCGQLGVFIEFDTAMNIVSQFPLNNGSMPDYSILRDSDTTFFAIYNSIDYWPLVEFCPTVEKIDLDGNVINQFVYLSPEDSSSNVAYRNALDTFPDGNLLLCATKNIDFYPGVQQEPTQIMFFKLTPDLDLIWQKFLFGDDGNYRVWSAKVHPDGGIVVSGTFSPTPPQNGAMEIFFMKTDSIGLLTGIDENEQQIKTTEAILYPNPARGFVNIEFSQLYQKATFQLMDIVGKLVLQKQLTANHQSINISGIPAGTYVYRIFNKDGLDERGKVVVE